MLAAKEGGSLTETSFELTVEQIEAAQASIQKWLDELPNTIRDERERLAKVYEPHDAFDVVANSGTAPPRSVEVGG